MQLAQGLVAYLADPLALQFHDLANLSHGLTFVSVAVVEVQHPLLALAEYVHHAQQVIGQRVLLSHQVCLVGVFVFQHVEQRVVVATAHGE